MFRRARWWQLTNREYSIQELAKQADKQCFNCLDTRIDHCLQQLLPSLKPDCYQLRARGHPYHFPSINSSIFKAVFISRCLFSFVWFCEISWIIYYDINYVFKCILDTYFTRVLRVCVMHANILISIFNLPYHMHCNWRAIVMLAIKEFYILIYYSHVVHVFSVFLFVLLFSVSNACYFLCCVRLPHYNKVYLLAYLYSSAEQQLTKCSNWPTKRICKR